MSIFVPALMALRPSFSRGGFASPSLLGASARRNDGPRSVLLRWSMSARRAWSETLARVAVILSLRGVGNVSEPVARRMQDELSPRHLALRVAQIAAVIAVGAVAISALPGLDEVRQRLAGTEPVWVAALVLAELGSCAGYVLVFRDTFCSQMPWGLSYEI